MEKSIENSCACGGAPKLIFPCSGASDVGEISDLAARKMTKDGIGKMYCLAGIGGGVSGIIESTKAVDNILAIDGCPLECARKTLEKAGITWAEHVEVTSLGYTKGNSPADIKNVSKVAIEGAKLLNGKTSCC